MAELGELHRDALTVSGRTAGDNVAGAPCRNRDVITSLEEPLQPAGTGLAVLRGNLCPDGAVIKVTCEMVPAFRAGERRGGLRLSSLPVGEAGGPAP